MPSDHINTTGLNTAAATSEQAQLNPVGAVVLCGGGSSRMGFEKARLVFGEQTFLERIIVTVENVTSRIVVVSPPGRTFDYLPAELRQRITWLTDKRGNKGPVEGIRVGLQHLEQSTEFAFVTSCDVPLLRSAVVDLLFAESDGYEAVVPTSFADDDKRQPLRTYGITALYRTDLHTRINELIDDGRLRVSELADEFKTKRIDVDSIRSVDPSLSSLTNINSADDYRRLLSEHSLTMLPEIRRALGEWLKP